MMKFNYAMEAINAASLAPFSVLRDKRAEQQPKKPSSVSVASTPKSSYTSASISRTFQGGLALVSSALGAPALAQALTYEEALGQSVTAPAFDDGAGGVLDSLISFAADNPVVLAGGVAALAVPLVLSRIFSKPKPYAIETAKKAYAVLGDDPSAQLLDIRAAAEVRKMGSPDVRGLGKKPVPIAYNGEDKPGFLKKLSLKFKEPESTTFYILDKFDGNSELVAELVTVNGFKAAYAIKDGAEGPKGWMNSGLPWIAPKKSFSFDLSSISDSISGALEGADALFAGLGLAAATGIGLLVFSEMETILQLLGSVALVQIASKKLIFVEDRKETVNQLDEFLKTKVAPKDLVDDIKQIGIALLPLSASGKSLPAPADPAVAESTVQKSEASPVAAPEPAAEPAPEPVLQINSVPKSEAKADPVPSFPRPLSPYPAYADFKPPTSPSPSQP